jgi:ATP adenylyltransferase
MDKIWAPWRREYIFQKDKEKGCILCNRANRDNDKEDYILFRGKYVFIIMNIYPYNNGHLMVAPYKHTASIEDINSEQGEEFFSVVKLGIKALEIGLKPDGFNIGMNIGRVAGAGIEDHIHMHIVPRWNGDTNFMPIFSNTKVLSVSLDETYNLLRKTIEKIL